MHKLLEACRAIARLSSEYSKPQDALQKIVSVCAQVLGAQAISVHRLSLRRSGYEQVANVGRVSHPAIYLFSELKALSDAGALRTLSHTITTGQPAHDQLQSGIFIDTYPILRNAQTACLGAIEIIGPAETRNSPECQAFVAAMAEHCLLLFEKQDTLELLDALQKPIDFRDQPVDDFLDAVLTLIANASGMPYIALRELVEEDTLQCIALYGFEKVAMPDFNLAPLSDFPPFATAILQGAAVSVPDISIPELQQLRAREDLSKVKSFAVSPVKVGSEIVGTLSFAAEIEYDYSDFELKAFTAIANAVGVSLSNFRNFNASQHELYQMAKVGAALAVDEIAQAVRHEARHYVQTARERLILLSNSLTRGDVQDANKHIKVIDDKLIQTSSALEKIKAITKPPEHELERFAVERVWLDAFAMVAGRLDVHPRISWNVKGSAEIDMYRDLLWHAFLNLILNSIDAFRSKAVKGNRRIEVAIDARSDAASTIHIRYSDNATGIDPTKLKPRPESGYRPAKDIFELGVSSKEGGSGYGLYLVRRVLASHNGSIELASYRNGVVFDITLPKRFVKS